MKRGLLALLAAWLAAPALAQLPSDLVEWPPLEAAERAFDSPYGRRLTENFARILERSADPVCRKERRIDRIRLEHEARAILVRRGGQALHIMDRLIDTQRFETALRMHGGADAKAELGKLRTDAAVRELLARHQPARLAKIANHVAELVDRYALLNRFRFTERVSPLASGDPELLEANPEDAAMEDARRFAASSSSPALRRWLELEQVLERARQASQRTDEALRLGPSQYVAGLGEDLTALCVPRL